MGCIFRDIEQNNELIKLKMNELIECINFDIIKIINIDQNNELYEMDSVVRPFRDFESESLNLQINKDLIQYIIETKNAVIINRTNLEFNNKVIYEFNPRYSHEVFVPFYNYNYETTGLIYYAKINGSTDDFRNNPNYINHVKQLLHLLEKQEFGYKIRENLYDTILLLCEVINAKQPHMIGNLHTVYHWAEKIALHLELPVSDIQNLHLATLMHDLGKIYIDESILNKTGVLTDDEYNIIKSRVNYSYELSLKINSIYGIDNVPEIILNYQERIDGTGYPNGTVGENIPLLSKILSVSKAMSSMLSNTLYRNALPIAVIIEELKLNSATQFDSEVAEAGIAILLSKKDELNDYFAGLGNYATLSIVFQGNDYVNLWGNIRRFRKAYKYRSIETITNFQLNQITSSNLYLNVNDRILRFKAEISRITTNEIIITKLISQNDEKSFSIKWFLQGRIIIKNRTKYDISIISVGGEFLDFYVFTESISDPITSGIISVNLTGDYLSMLPGAIIYQQQVNDKTYYRLEYISLSDTERKRVYSSIFKKQLEQKRLLRENAIF